jgi:cell wall-associated NlpC family hydrolase
VNEVRNRQRVIRGTSAGISLLVTIVVLGIASGAALAQTGGSAAPGAIVTPPPTTTAPMPAPVAGAATLAPDGTAIPPANAPRAVRKAINAGNRIHTLPYLWGGGHNTTFAGTGYDCSGAVSYVLHAAGLLRSPLVSGGLAHSWGVPGVGSWITVYANKTHAYAVIAGLRWDTSAVGESLDQGSGPRWRLTQRSPVGYAAKYYPGL